jgi:hypothetical protein
MSSSTLLMPSRSVDQQEAGLLSPRGACGVEHSFARTSFGDHAQVLKPTQVSQWCWVWCGAERLAF